MINGKNEIFANAKIFSYKDYIMLPETMLRYEIIDGEVIMAPSPTVIHQLLVRNLSYALHRHVTEKKLGHVLFAPIDVQISETPFRTRQPDVLFISKQRSGFTGRDSLLGVQLLDFAPELVVEVLSPSDTRSKMEENLKNQLLKGGYDTPNWAQLQADAVGYNRALQEILKLIEEN